MIVAIFPGTQYALMASSESILSGVRSIIPGVKHIRLSIFESRILLERYLEQPECLYIERQSLAMAGTSDEPLGKSQKEKMKQMKKSRMQIALEEFNRRMGEH